MRRSDLETITGADWFEPLPEAVVNRECSEPIYRRCPRGASQ